MTWRTYADWAKTRPATLRLADRLGRGRGRFRWLDRMHPPPRAARKPDLRRWNDHSLAAVWIGHATVLVRIGGMTILTDPVLSNRVGIGLGLITGGPRRMHAPALYFDELPPIDLILVSHAHFDHLDCPTLSRFPKHIPVITAPQTRDLIDDLGFTNVNELRWGQAMQVGSLCLRGQQVRHWGARTFHDDHRGYNAYVIESGRMRVLYGGDTAFQDYFRDIGRVDLAVLGIGCYNPWIEGHATPEQAWDMAGHAHADFVLPMHHSTFRLSHEPMDEPLRRLMEAAGRDEGRIVAREIGGMWVRD